MARYDHEQDVDACWYLDHGWPHDAADLLVWPGAILMASEQEFQQLQPLIERHGVQALYLNGDIHVFTDTEAAELLRELELDQGRRGPVPIAAPARVPRTRQSR